MAVAARVELWFKQVGIGAGQWRVNLCETRGAVIKCLGVYEDRGEAVRCAKDAAHDFGLPACERDRRWRLGEL